MTWLTISYDWSNIFEEFVITQVSFLMKAPHELTQKISEKFDPGHIHFMLTYIK